MKKAITLFFAFAIFGAVAMAQSDADQAQGGAQGNTGTNTNPIEAKIATEVQNLDARINMNASQESAATNIIRTAVNDVMAKKKELKGDREAYMEYREQRIDQAVDELEQHLTPTQFQQAKDYAQQRGFNL